MSGNNEQHIEMVQIDDISDDQSSGALSTYSSVGHGTCPSSVGTVGWLIS